MKLLWRFLDSLFETGDLTVIDAAGKTRRFGDQTGAAVTIRFHDRALQRQFLLSPSLAVGEGYMDGRLTVENGDIFDFIKLGQKNIERKRHQGWIGAISRIRRIFRILKQLNPRPKARRNVAHHYDLSDSLYSRFLDDDRQYSCAYFMSDSDSLEQAQENKKRHLAAKLLPEPGQKILDIGCGWGGLGLYLAGETNAEIVGITLSEEQHKVARDRARSQGLADRVEFRLQDYRDVTERFDRIVSVGMLEHVGVPYYPRYFEQVRDLLADDGVAVIHTIGRLGGPGATDPWLEKYIFPGGYCPALSELVSVIERTGLVITDIEILRLHYAKTLRKWRENFAANREEIKEIYDERFCRMWEFYLAGAEVSFYHGGLAVFQIQLARDQEAVPLTRDYITDWERRQINRRTDAAE